MLCVVIEQNGLAMVGDDGEEITTAFSVVAVLWHEAV
jgi:hypothetical protein